MCSTFISFDAANSALLGVVLGTLNILARYSGVGQFRTEAILDRVGQFWTKLNNVLKYEKIFCKLLCMIFLLRRTINV